MIGIAARRYLLGAIALPGEVGVVGLAALLGPWSPLALDRANARYTAGDIAGAEHAYADLTEGWRTPGTRAEAATRAGLLALAGGDAQDAATLVAAAVYRERAGSPDRALDLWMRAMSAPGDDSARAEAAAGLLRAERAMGAVAKAEP